MVTKDQLVEAVKASTKKMSICVPSQDYYSRSGDWQSETIVYVDPQYLISELEKLNGED